MTAHTLHSIPIEGQNAWISLPENTSAPLPVLYMAAESDFPNEHASIIQALDELGFDVPFALAAFAVEDWNRELTPWPAPALFKKAGDFAGGAPATLAWLLQSFLPAVEASYAVQKTPEGRGILGYSLSGLFALWTLYQTDQFGLCGACSGSLWYDGWHDFMTAHTPRGRAKVYLSLGDTEGKAKNQRMAAVQDVTLATEVLLSQSPSISKCTLAWNPGGHFNEVPLRLARAIHWLLHR